MKRVTGLVFSCVAASCLAASAATTAPAPVAHKQPPGKAAATIVLHQPALNELAPADEYFGPFKLSIIGIRNTLRDVGLRYDFNHDIGTQSFVSAQQTERSIRDWEHRYPHDDQLPRAVYLLQRLYTKVLVAASRQRAHATALWLLADFANSPQAKQLKKTLSVEHLPPLPPATPAPVAAATSGPPGRYQSALGPSYPSAFNATMNTVASPTPAADPGATH